MVNAQFDSLGITGCLTEAIDIAHLNVKRGDQDAQVFTLKKVASPTITEDTGNLNLDIEGLDVEFTSAHGYSRSELAHNYVMNAIVRQANLCCRIPDQPQSQAQSRPSVDIIKIPIDLDQSDLDDTKRRATVFYDGTPGHQSKVTYSKALEEYCKIQAGIQFSKLQQTQPRNHAREPKTRIDRRA